ncbi:hypothetical protein RCF98_04715 [Thiothrix lacustris]|uniref:Uncharacterized protein n=1 Tax=Thiothrix lacustris TaxID=525917 RepID=A0ABY9MSL9_9GAMM|nr:hypothetical protein [Thiothrix lacustris]WML91644.1 hypothetical protein RCF98_04715 [Thiothrix lacustris]
MPSKGNPNQHGNLHPLQQTKEQHMPLILTIVTALVTIILCDDDD